MDEISAIKYIFKNVEEDTDNGIVKIEYNGRIFTINCDSKKLTNYKNIYDYVLREEARVVEINNEKGAEIEADFTEVIKITDEQFFEWLDTHRKYKSKDEQNSGKSIWMSLKGNDAYE